ncbi:MAG TPA: hypothetical protein VFZ09_00060 [Archangium sp.]|uniref:hypothetical protein n=1 Tax=Archangium sp. TaxID=1872627 RepID=UPI002E32CF6E|nr:hypothetical protein [Archangium sp.]HEX5744598.1 hypothetical protein [Archangium sp.]
MSRTTYWAILAPGEPAWLERRARAIVMTEADEEDGKEPPFEVISGNGRYSAIAGTDPMDIGAELRIAEEVSLEVQQPVYSIDCANDPWLVMSWRNGVGEVQEVAPEALAKSLGCPLPDSDESSDVAASKPLRKAALVEGIRAQEANRVLEEDAGAPLVPGHYRLEDTPQGLLLTGGTGSMGFAHVTLSERLPHSTVYGVTASPGLDTFYVSVLRGGECIGQFAQPPYAVPPFPVFSDIKGERSPERILTALGIPAEWFRNE